MTSNDDQKSVLYTDVCLLLFLALIGIMAILMALTGHVLLNTIFLFCTLAVLLITYFFGIIASLITNLGFIALQTIIVIYQYLDGTQTIPWGLTYWMILPLVTFCDALFYDEKSS